MVAVAAAVVAETEAAATAAAEEDAAGVAEEISTVSLKFVTKTGSAPFSFKNL